MDSVSTKHRDSIIILGTDPQISLNGKFGIRNPAKNYYGFKNPEGKNFG